MRRLSYNIFTILFLCVIWVILMESITLKTVIIGIILGCVSLSMTNRLIDDYYNSICSISLLMIIKYVLYLLSRIYLSGFSTIGNIISGRVNVGIVEIDTHLEDDVQIAIMANSITLTPGTVTLDRQGQRLKVLCIDCSGFDSEKAACMIKKGFEDILHEGKGCS